MNGQLEAIYLDKKQAATVAHCSPRTIVRWARAGLIPERYLRQSGKKLLVLPEGIDAALRSFRARFKPGR